MNTLDDQALIHTYEDAVNLKLEEEFIQILYAEINKRKLDLNIPL
ncbi:MAG: sporulation histidine kinase inhibitor Sda [Parachlamydiaceae bacterium]|nr:sporulation histidine kinase inhibitor Sda [Parachlamydiaceae bacterium]